MIHTQADINIYILGAHELAYSYYNKLSQHNKNLNAYQSIYLIESNPDNYAQQKLSEQGIDSTQIIKSISYHDFLIQAALDPHHHQGVLIPDHTAYHVLLKVFMDVVSASSNWSATLAPMRSDLKFPYTLALQEGSLNAISFATGTCPLYCDEPAHCPLINDARTWDLQSITRTDLLPVAEVKDQCVLFYDFACAVLIPEVSAIPMLDIISKINDFKNKLKTTPPKRVYVFTHSHCHGIVGNFMLKKISD